MSRFRRWRLAGHAVIGLAVVTLGKQTVSATGPVVLNEVLASNQRAVPVGGRYPDFVELFNPTSVTVDLTGATLADNSATQIPFQFPAGTRMGPGTRLVIWCDQSPGLPSPQASFGIGATTDFLQLRGPLGEIWDELALGIQIPDFSIGRVPDGQTSWKLNRPTPALANQEQPLANRTGLFINEWMASPATGDDWLEVFCASELPVSLDGLRLTDQTGGAVAHRPIPSLSFIAGGGFVQFFASDLRRPDADHLDFRLSASGETLSLRDSDGVTILDQVTFGPQASGVSQGRVPDGGPTVLVFPAGQGTPGAANVKSLTRIIISEVLSHTDPPKEDAIELHNPTDAPIDVSHWWLSDAADQPRKYRIPPNTVIAAQGFWVAYEYQFGSGAEGFSLNSYEGDEVWLSTGDAAGGLTGERGMVRFGAIENGVAIGRVPTSDGFDFAPLSRPTFGVDAPVSLPQFRLGRGSTNAPPRDSPLQIAEIFFATTEAPASATESFVELHNAGGQAEPLYDPVYPTNVWRLRGAATFDFPNGRSMEAGERLVIVAFDPNQEPARLARFRSAHALAESVGILGPFTGNLATGDWNTWLELQRPDVPEGPTKPKPGFVPYARAERIDYPARRESHWPFIGIASGLALTRRSPNTFSNDGSAWLAATPSPGRSEASGPTTDTDADGMPDDWELRYGLDPERGSDATEDPDGDGANHRDEYRANTHPHDAASVLKLAVEIANGQIAVTFDAAAGREHRLESRSAESSSWTLVTAFPRTELPVKQSVTVVPGATTQWLRVGVPQVP